VPLMAEDIVFIPNNTAREMAGKITQTAVGLASGGTDRRGAALLIEGCAISIDVQRDRQRVANCFWYLLSRFRQFGRCTYGY